MQLSTRRFPLHQFHLASLPAMEQIGESLHSIYSINSDLRRRQWKGQTRRWGLKYFLARPHSQLSRFCAHRHVMAVFQSHHSKGKVKMKAA